MWLNFVNWPAQLGNPKPDIIGDQNIYSKTFVFSTLGMGFSAKAFLQQHAPHPKMTNKHYISLSKTQKNALHTEVARRKSPEKNTAGATMTA